LHGRRRLRQLQPNLRSDVENRWPVFHTLA
jgi:hypothetical protein